MSAEVNLTEKSAERVMLVVGENSEEEEAFFMEGRRVTPFFDPARRRHDREES